MDSAGQDNTLRHKWAGGENEIIGIIYNFILITISCIFKQIKKYLYIFQRNSVGIIKVSVVPMANTMYFIQRIVMSYQNGYKSYKNNCVHQNCMYLILFSYSVQIQLMLQNTTRTTRMPVFWGHPSTPTAHCPMITHTIHSYWIPSQNKTKSKLQI